MIKIRLQKLEKRSIFSMAGIVIYINSLKRRYKKNEINRITHTVVPLFSTQHLKGNTDSLSRIKIGQNSDG